MAEPATVGTLLREGIARLGVAQRRDLELLLAGLLGLNLAGLIRESTSPVEPARVSAWREQLLALAAGTPVAQLLGHWEFWSLEFEVDSHVLIPRPDTELLVETGIALAAEVPAGPVLDAGTGSGVIAVCMARECADRAVLAVDRSATALAVARRNAERLAPGRIGFLQGNWLTALAPARFALLLGNPPYIAENDPALEATGSLRFEPRSALAAGTDGLSDLSMLAGTAGAHLLPGGAIALEHGWNQGDAVRRLLGAAGFSRIETRRDLAGHERVTLGHWQPAAPRRNAEPRPY